MTTITSRSTDQAHIVSASRLDDIEKAGSLFPGTLTLVRQVGADRVLMGSDYCFPIAYEQPVKVVTDNAGLSDADKHAITETNARRLLRL